jgi:hypothetical protein
VLYNRNKTELYIYPAGKSGDFLIPGSVVSVGAYAFSDCRGLRSVEIPKSVASLGSNAFGGCSGLKDVTVEWAVPLLPAAGASVFESVSLSVCTLHVPVGAGAVYKAANVWKDFGTVTEITPELTVPSEEIAFAFGGGRDSVTVVSNMGWTVASGGSPWLTVTPASGGFGRDTIRLTAVANTGTLVRRETLVFKGGGITRYVAVVQETNPVDNAVIGSTEIVYAGGRLSVNTPVSERITVYALSGVIVYQSQKMPGSATFDLTGLPRGLMIVRGDSGWVKKIVR